MIATGVQHSVREFTQLAFKPKWKRFMAEGRINRLKSSIKTMVFTLYGIKISDREINNIVGSLE